MDNNSETKNIVNVDMNTEGVDSLIEKVSQLKKLLLEVKEIINSLNDLGLPKIKEENPRNGERTIIKGNLEMGENRTENKNTTNENICSVCGLNHKDILANGLNSDESRKQFLMNVALGKEKYSEIIGAFSGIIKKYNLDSTPNTFKDLMDEIKYLTLHKF